MSVVRSAFDDEYEMLIRRGLVRSDTVVVEGPSPDGVAQKFNIPLDALVGVLNEEFGIRLVPDDAIVIERSELPEVTVRSSGELVSGELLVDEPEGVEYARRAAIEWLSVSEHLSVHPPVQPPVDPKVRANLADALVRAGVGTSWSDCARIAEGLIANSTRLTEDGAR